MGRAKFRTHELNSCAACRDCNLLKWMFILLVKCELLVVLMGLMYGAVGMWTSKWYVDVWRNPFIESRILFLYLDRRATLYLKWTNVVLYAILYSANSTMVQATCGWDATGLVDKALQFGVQRYARGLRFRWSWLPLYRSLVYQHNTSPCRLPLNVYGSSRLRRHHNKLQRLWIPGISFKGWTQVTQAISVFWRKSL